MSYRQTEFADDEWYHCYSRSIDRKTVFESEHDYNRFLQALYLSNSSKKMDRSRYFNPTHAEILSIDRGEPLVAIGAYSLMPNHFHILIRQIVEDGISKFMHKTGTSFSMYFNVKKKHVGNVFVKPFRAKHVDNDPYLKCAAQYIHFNVAEIFEPGWKQGAVRDFGELEKDMRTYPYSSLPDYLGINRPENAILDPVAMSFFDNLPNLAEILTEAAEYYASIDL